VADHAAAKAAHQIVHLIGAANASLLVRILLLPDDDRLALVARLHQRTDAKALADVLTDIESDPDDLTRLRLAAGLQDLLRRHPPR
jgi:hypothetical protein